MSFAMGGQGSIEQAVGARLGQGATRLFCGTTYRPGYCLADQTIAPLFALQKEGLRGQGAIEPSLIAPAAGTLKGQGATQLPVATYCPMLRAQGATEYLVLLAVVLVIALVAIALLGFFPGMASDAQVTQSEMYWKSATPIAIVEASARYVYDATPSDYTFLYLRIRNTGMYPITITKILAGNSSISHAWGGFWVPTVVLSDKVKVAPGEEFVFGYNGYFPGVLDLGSGNRTYFSFSDASGNVGYDSNFRSIAQSLCRRTAPYGLLVVNGFGFEYVSNVDGKAITKRQMGSAPLVIRCTNNYN